MRDGACALSRCLSWFNTSVVRRKERRWWRFQSPAWCRLEARLRLKERQTVRSVNEGGGGDAAAWNAERSSNKRRAGEWRLTAPPGSSSASKLGWIPSHAIPRHVQRSLRERAEWKKTSRLGPSRAFREMQCWLGRFEHTGSETCTDGGCLLRAMQNEWKGQGKVHRTPAMPRDCEPETAKVQVQELEKKRMICGPLFACFSSRL